MEHIRILIILILKDIPKLMIYSISSFFSAFLPAVASPTRITHNTSTLTDNIYIKCKRYDELVWG
ncbi:hypothetical protein LSH36_116g04019 [Paralvinella palmiformis]|uniref:Uncharacterized protein n=1 Tax=Paralvinella palmiformis TaxID=53620 RepID=A0AAD9K073_9ANNE|nr:hypothetical protein LSH36_116g04019 [Paralvinella palmiformis]